MAAVVVYHGGATISRSNADEPSVYYYRLLGLSRITSGKKGSS